MTAPPLRTNRHLIRPTATEFAAQAVALDHGGKPAEVLVKAARDLVVVEAVWRATGSGPAHRHEAEAARTRFAQHALGAGVHVTELGATVSETAIAAARILARYLPA